MTSVEHVDVLIVGAGISGIGAAHYLRTERPQDSFLIVEARDAIGGTWDLFRYPGVRSDSDLYTFGYAFKPWREEESIATGDKILAYLAEAVADDDLGERIRFRHRVRRAAWSSEVARWEVEVDVTDAEGLVTGRRFSARWIFCGTGYYRYDAGYTPELPGRDRFSGEVIHPQHWPGDFDPVGKRIVVIGSGATAVTLVPALASAADHVTLLQRTPTYVLPVGSRDPIAHLLQRHLNPDRAHAVIRAKQIAQQRLVWSFCQRFPRLARRLIRAVNEKVLPDGYPVAEHFTPPYDPWDQRLCAAPDGDFFRALRRGTASMVTDRIATLTETGLELASGAHLDADVIVTATGLNLLVAGGIELSVDGEPVRYPDRVIYRGLMLSGVPNFALAIGYTNASWTLKIDLLCTYLVRLLDHLDAEGYDAVRPIADPADETRPLLDFAAGYVTRSLADLPRQGSVAPWVMSRSYAEDRRLIRSGPVADDRLRFERAACVRSGG